MCSAASAPAFWSRAPSTSSTRLASLFHAEGLPHAGLSIAFDGRLHRIDFESVADRKIAEIAYGQQRLLEIALALALKPKVLLLDEPAAGVSHAETPRIDTALAGLPDNLAC